MNSRPISDVQYPRVEWVKIQDSIQDCPEDPPVGIDCIADGLSNGETTISIGGMRGAVPWTISAPLAGIEC